jgi:uncharacterized HAD superfamily protein
VRIGIDIDGVLYKWSKTARYLLREALPDSPYKVPGHPLYTESTHWNYIQQNVAPEHWKWLWTEGVKAGLFRHGHIIKGAIEGMRTLAADGHDLVIITHRPKAAVTDTLQWLAFCNFPLAGIHIMTGQEPKSMALPHCAVYIDDKPENVYNLANNTGARLVALMDAPWNQQAWGGGLFERVLGWADFVQRVRGLK